MKNTLKTCLLLSVFAASLTACGWLPSSGPSTNRVTSLGQSNQQAVPEVALLDIENSLIQDISQRHLIQSLSALEDNSTGFDVVNRGDVLEITIWEAAPAMLFGGAISETGAGTAHVTKLPPQTVSSQGTVSIPFVGNLSVVGKSLEQIQNLIQGNLKRKANQPQVIVSLAQNNATNVLVVRAGNSIRMPLTPARERILDALAAVGGSTANVQDTTIQITRDQKISKIALEDLVSDPTQNILLHRGDVVTVITNPYTFTSMGAVGKAQEIGFSARGLSLAEAVGRMGGLQDRRSDARGVFVFRYTPFSELPTAEQPKWAEKGYNTQSDIPTVYRLDLTNANSMLWMQKFPIHNKDVVYVSNAPLAEVQKFLQFVFSPVTSGASSINNISN
ncbi:MAG: polysaccharide export protein [Neisseriaceae bacterium]|nr:polysaccharide export protein [Neisseriaceae bacterium]